MNDTSSNIKNQIKYKKSLLPDIHLPSCLMGKTTTIELSSPKQKH
jgi:hypothetical protein